jgi:RNA polymerase sigma-70 factor (ECF subfamily)
LRSYLIASVKNFLADERRRAMATKRGKGERLVPLEALGADERIDMQPADPLTAERIYERRWAATVLDQALNLLKDAMLTCGVERSKSC